MQERDEHVQLYRGFTQEKKLEMDEQGLYKYISPL